MEESRGIKFDNLLHALCYQNQMDNVDVGKG